MTTLHRTIFAVLTVAALAVSAGGAPKKTQAAVKRPVRAAHRKITLSAFALLPAPKPARVLPSGM